MRLLSEYYIQGSLAFSNCRKKSFPKDIFLLGSTTKNNFSYNF